MATMIQARGEKQPGCCREPPLLRERERERERLGWVMQWNDEDGVERRCTTWRSNHLLDCVSPISNTTQHTDTDLAVAGRR